jgi:uncharacterized damage-inducible protein DinB
MIDPGYCKHMARYNRWQNESIYASAAKLNDDTRKRNMGAFFKSIHATLNHLMVGDRLWLSRFDKEPSGVTTFTQELYNNFEELTQQRRWTDDRMDRFVSVVTSEHIAQSITFRRMRDDVEVTMPLDICLMQYFNHGTHHRGQVTTLLMQCGVDPGVTDLPFLSNDFLSPVFGK